MANIYIKCLQNFWVSLYEYHYKFSLILILEYVVNLFAEKQKTKFSQMVMQFGQFLDHDLTLTPEQERDCTNPDVLSRDEAEDPALRICFNIDVQDDDQFYANRTQSLPITRSDGICNGNVREQFNSLTAFIDGSQIYGSDEALSKQLRTLKNGLLKVHRLGPTLPTRSQTGLLDEHFRSEDLVAGDIRAIEQPGQFLQRRFFEDLCGGLYNGSFRGWEP